MVGQGDVEGAAGGDQAGGDGAVGGGGRGIAGDGAHRAGGQGQAEEGARLGVGAVDVALADHARLADQALACVQGQAPQLLVAERHQLAGQVADHVFGRTQADAFPAEKKSLKCAGKKHVLIFSQIQLPR